MKPSTAKQKYVHRTAPSSLMAWGVAQRGFSLIELMVSITIGLLILVSLSSMFINQSKTRVELDKSNRMIDNGRYALELLTDNLRVAGFFDNIDTFPLISAPVALYDPCDTASLTDATKNRDIFDLPIHGYDATTVTSQAALPAGLAALPCGLSYTTGSDKLKSGSDILVVRRVSTAVSPVATNGITYLQVSMCGTDAATPPNNYQIVTAPSATFASMHKKLCTASGAGAGDGLADLRPFLSQAYFVSPDNKSGDGIPTLKRAEIDPSGATNSVVVTPLVEGIEFMQVEYGVDDPTKDTDGDGAVGLDGIPDSYTSCSACTLTQWSNVVAVKIYIVARNNEATTGYQDPKTYNLGPVAGNYTPTGTGLSYKRHAYTQLVSLTNQSGRRQ